MTRCCASCLSSAALPGDVYCATCRTAPPVGFQLAWDALLPATTDHQHVPGQLDLSDALDEGATDHA